jgi:hypothetical protein
MSRLRGQWPETLDSTFDRRLTARPAVLAKNVRTGSSRFPSYGDDPGRTYPEATLRFVYLNLEVDSAQNGGAFRQSLRL